MGAIPDDDRAEAAASAPPSEDDRAQLERAFRLFNEVSGELTSAYEALQARVAGLTEELAVANGALREQYLAKEALSERLKLLLDALPAGVVVLDAQGRIEDANPAAHKALGEPLIGQEWELLATRRLTTTLTPEEFLCQGRRLSLTRSALASAGGQLLLISDITLAHDMKARLARNQRLAAMGEMAAGLAHQMRTPLATALLYTSHLGNPALPPRERGQFADKAGARLRHLEQLIRDTLLFARGEALAHQDYSARDLLDEVVTTVEPLMLERGVNLVQKGNVGDLVLHGDRRATAGALVNLLENALQASPAGAEVALSAAPESGVLSIIIEDSGPGIPDDLRDRLFQPFFTTRDRGTGLGLAIARSVARAHGGDIEVSDSPDGGARFLFSIRTQGESEQ